MPAFAIDSDLVPIDAANVTIEGEGVPVDWANTDVALGWLVGELVVESE